MTKGVIVQDIAFRESPPEPSLAPPGDEHRSRERRPIAKAIAMIGIAGAGAALVVASMLGTTRGGEATAASVGTTVNSSEAVETSTAASLTPVSLVDVSEIAAEVVDSVVTVNVTFDVRGPRDLTGSGSGIVLDADSPLVVTNAHVVSGAAQVDVTLADGSTFAAEVVGIDVANDVAVLTVGSTSLAAIEVGSSEGLAVGDPVIAVGNPLGLEGGPSVTTGIVSALGRVLGDSSVSLSGVIQTDAAITEGSSGGALLDSQGRLIGMTTAVGVSSIGIEGIGFAVPVETVMSVVATLTVG